MARINITISDDDHAKLKEFSEKNDDSISNIARKYVELGLLLEEKKEDQTADFTSPELQEYLALSTIETKFFVKKLYQKIMEATPQNIKEGEKQCLDKYKEFFEEPDSVL